MTEKTVAMWSVKALRGSAFFWFAVATTGQLAFVLYIAGFYGRAAARGDFERWNQVLVGGYVPGGLAGNLVLAMHLLLAAVITLGGPLQLVPAIRRRWPRVHRWNGRAYMLTALLISLGGLYMVWTRGTAGGPSLRIGISLNGLLIIGAATVAWRFARQRRFAEHRRWALRTFVLASGVWFFRVGLMFWILANRGPVGIGPDFDGPFVRAWAFGCYLVPLALLELYLAAERRGPLSRFAAAAGLGLLTLAAGVGIFGAVMAMWLPRLLG
ncbi:MULTISPECIES: DUF2306 domain-containing protein [Sphingomonas]|uniref:DUF2306 domain-containing protein n=1 Tax=Sphingomonas leidyi TaxID=68569 RepID=A0A7X5ZTV3_9SPHN|nr:MULTISPECIES: DUF2306 domain-containing protein [Sphingomonas]MBN8811973.1 DUF2306 domain-containing protein [Sphingomonas sp.]NIJ63375.1 hypothetical protein [Sphingomonas leidyi]OJY48376.1 MAG: hypothetical protein BGP17_00925 [Sphingomonas sp. 67-41]